MRKDRYHVEYTDTFSGEANYSWVRRYIIDVPEGSKQRAVMRAAKRAAGLNGVRGRATEAVGDGYEFRPYRSCTVLFVTYSWDQS